MQRRTRTWTIAGAGLIASGVVGLSRVFVPGMAGIGVTLSVVADVLWAASVLLFAWGVSGRGSVVASRALGRTALTVVALWPLVTTVAAGFVDFSYSSGLQTWTVGAYVSLFVTCAASLIAVVQIGRAGAVAAPWNWAAAWVFAAQVVLWAVAQGVAVAGAGRDGDPALAGLFSFLTAVVFLAGTVGLGVLAIVRDAWPEGESAREAASA